MSIRPELLAPAAVHLTTGWEPTLPADDGVVRNYLLTLVDRLSAQAVAVDGRVEHRHGAVLVDLASPYIFDNIVVVMGPWSIDHHRQFVAEAREFFPAERTWTLLSLSPVVDLRPAGLGLLGHPPLMWRPAGGAVPQVLDGLTIERVVTEQHLADFERTLVEGFPLPAGGTITDPRLLDGALTAWVGYIDGEPVATAGSHSAHGLTEVEWVSTRTTHRGRGIGAAMTHTAATADPTIPSILIATDDGQPVYRRLGYVPLLRLTMWLRPGQT